MGMKTTRPLFSIGDIVALSTRAGNLVGTVAVVDYRGRERACFKGCDWSYDIMVDDAPGGGGPCLFKHIPECDVKRA